MIEVETLKKMLCVFASEKCKNSNTKMFVFHLEKLWKFAEKLKIFQKSSNFSPPNLNELETSTITPNSIIKSNVFYLAKPQNIKIRLKIKPVDIR
jgi:hypothetical protein